MNDLYQLVADAKSILNFGFMVLHTFLTIFLMLKAATRGIWIRISFRFTIFSSKGKEVFLPCGGSEHYL